MKKIYNPEKTSWKSILERPTACIDDVEETVLKIFDEVIDGGDEIIKKYTTQFDGVSLDEIKVSIQEIEEGIMEVSDDLKKSMDHIVKSEVNKKWGEYMSDILKAEVDPKTNFPYLLPIQMHLD